MTILIIWVIICVVLVIAVIIHSLNENEKERRELAISSRTDFTDSKVVKDNSASLYFAVDNGRQEVFCYSRANIIRFKYQDIVTVEIKIDGDTVVSKKSASIGGALAGGLIAGGLGAVVGGSSLGKYESKRNVTAVDVHVLLRNSSVDSFDIQCFVCESMYATACKNAQDIFDILRIAMDEVQMKTTQSIEVKTFAPKSIVEELKELAELRQQGFITEEEFVTFKAKILCKEK